jgi:hypothetical protein
MRANRPFVTKSQLDLFGLWVFFVHGFGSSPGKVQATIHLDPSTGGSVFFNNFLTPLQCEIKKLRGLRLGRSRGAWFKATGNWRFLLHLRQQPYFGKGRVWKKTAISA